MHKNIVKNTAIISIGTNASRVLGLIRDMVIAGFFGTGNAAGAFVVAFTLPNIFRDFFGEGASNAAIIPALAEYKIKDSKKEFWCAVNGVFWAVTAVLFMLSVIGVVLAPVLVRIIAPGFMGNPEALTMTINLTRVVFPYIFFIGLTVFFMGVLNTLNHFIMPAFSQARVNFILILVTIILCPVIGVMGLAIGVLIGGICEVLIQLPLLYKEGFRIQRPNADHPIVKKIAKLLIPRVVGAGVYQANVMVDRIFASLTWIVGAGCIPALYFAYRLIQYPLGVFSTALATAVLPAMSYHRAKNETEDIKKMVSFALRATIFILIPSAVGLMVLGKPLIQVLFQRGEFDLNSTFITYQALFFYSVGLTAYGGVKILATTFYALHDTMTPVKASAKSLLVNIIMVLVFIFPLKTGGLALATSLAGFYNFFTLYTALDKKLNGIGREEIFKAFYKILISCAPVVLAGLWFSGLITDASANIFIKILYLLLAVALSAVIFLVTAFLLRVREAKEIISWILKSKKL